MPLNKQIISIPYARGISTKMDPLQLPANRAAVIQNGYFYTPESIRKRNGFVALSNSFYDASSGAKGALGDAEGLYTRESGVPFAQELLMATGNHLMSYSPSSAYAAWVMRTATTANPTGTKFLPARLTSIPVERSLDALTAGDSSTQAQGVQAFVWQSGSFPAHTTIMDTASGTSLLSSAPVGNQSVDWPTYPKVFQLGTVNGKPQFIYIVWEKVGAGAPRLAFYKATMGVSTGYAVSAATAAPVTDVGVINVGNPVYDATLFNGKIYVAYLNNAGNIAAFTIDTTSDRTVPTGITSGGTSDAQTLAVFGKVSTSEVWFIWGTTTNGRYKIFNAALNAIILAETVFATDATIRTVAGTPFSGSVYSAIFYETTAKLIRRFDLTNAGAVTFNNVIFGNMGLASKFTSAENNQNTFFWVTYPSATQPCYFMYALDLLTSVPTLAAKAAQGAAGGLTYNPALPEINTISSLNFQTTLMQADEVIPVSGGVNLNLGVMSASVQYLANLPAAELAGTLHLAGAVLWAYDGSSVVEHGFMLYPEINSIAAVGAGGALSAGTYEYIVVFEWADEQGQVHQSAPSVPFKFVANANDAATITYKNMWVTQKTLPASAPLNVGIYRTQKNGSVYFRVNGYSPTAAPQYTITNSTIVFTDTLADSAIISSQQLYTTGGEVDNASVPAALVTTQYRNRMIVVPSENTLSWWFSKELVPNTPVEFSSLFVQTIDQRGGGITGLAVLDDKLIFFKVASIFAVVGDGPAPNGTGNDYGQGHFVTTDTGAIYAGSVVSMPDGIMFQSARGIELLDRGMAAHYIGADVEAYVQGNAVLSATLVPSLNQVRFMLSSGYCVVYDYFAKDPNTGMGQWSVNTNHASAGLGSVLRNNAFNYVTTTGTVMVETGNVFTDNGAFVELGVVGAWISLAGLQGFQRVYKAMILGAWESSHNLVISVAYDFDPTIVQTETIVATSAPANQYQWRILLNRQKCEAIRFTIQDAQNGPAAESARFSAIALEIGGKAGLQKAPQTKTYG